MTAINIELDQRELKAQIARLSARVSDIRPALDEIGATIAESIRLLFTDGTDPYGTPWAPVRFRMFGTDKRRAAANAQPLLDTGRLRNSITHEVRADGVEIGTNVLYAAVHQFGATIKAKNRPRLAFMTPGGLAQPEQVEIPARPFLPTKGLPPLWIEEVREIVASYIETANA